ncbi:alpha/beta hydrolase [Gramella sp. AN32]|nr:alpha/beta hydrolase [Gramella sp. AN32]
MEKKKDYVPVQRLLIPLYILKISKFLTWFSPKIASRFAARLFLTPFRYKIPDREKEMNLNSEQENLILPKSKKQIRVYKYGSSSKKILLVHGWSGSGTQMSKIAKALLQEGYATISFDAPAHGKMEGKFSMMPYFIESLHFLNEKFGPFDAIIGHSLGGISTLRAVQEGVKTKKLVIIGTANSISKITRDFAKNMEMNNKVAKLMQNYLEKKFGEEMEQYSGALSAKSITYPTLILHDENDVDVSVQDAYEIDAALKNSELLITKSLGHRRILGNPKVINKISTFITA